MENLERNGEGNAFNYLNRECIMYLLFNYVIQRLQLSCIHYLHMSFIDFNLLCIYYLIMSFILILELANSR